MTLNVLDETEEKGAGGRAPARPALVSRNSVEALLVPAAAFFGSLVAFGIFIAAYGVNPLALYELMYRGAFGSWFSWQNTLVRAAPLLLTALCTALPAQLGMVVIGGEGAFVIGGLAATATGLALAGGPPLTVQLAMAGAGMLAGGAWIALVGGLRHYRGVNETIASLLLVYIAIALLNHLVEGPMRDPASLNKPSTQAIAAADMIGAIPGTDIHWGLVFRNRRGAPRLCPRPSHRLWLCGAHRRRQPPGRQGGGALGRPAGAHHVLPGRGRGRPRRHGRGRRGRDPRQRQYRRRLRHHRHPRCVPGAANPLAIIPVAILLGGIGAAGGLIQRRLGLPDASVLVLQGIIFLMVLASDALYGRIRIFQPREG